MPLCLHGQKDEYKSMLDLVQKKMMSTQYVFLLYLYSNCSVSTTHLDIWRLARPIKGKVGLWGCTLLFENQTETVKTSDTYYEFNYLYSSLKIGWYGKYFLNLGCWNNRS